MSEKTETKTEKRCSKCGVFQPIDEYIKPSGTECKTCETCRAKGRAYNRTRKELKESVRPNIVEYEEPDDLVNDEIKNYVGQLKSKLEKLKRRRFVVMSDAVPRISITSRIKYLKQYYFDDGKYDISNLFPDMDELKIVYQKIPVSVEFKGQSGTRQITLYATHPDYKTVSGRLLQLSNRISKMYHIERKKHPDVINSNRTNIYVEDDFIQFADDVIVDYFSEHPFSDWNVDLDLIVI